MVVVDVVAGAAVVVVVDVVDGVVVDVGAVVCWVPSVVADRVVEVVESTTSGSRVTTRGLDVVTSGGGAVVVAKAAVVGISTDGWITRLRT